MLETDSNLVLILGACMATLIVLQLLTVIYMAISLRIASSERTRMNKEMFGLLRKIEGLTAHRRDQMLKHYDTILDNLSVRLPPTIAATTGQAIYEAESKILKRLAELEPDLKGDKDSQQKMNDLIKSMESLETMIVTLTSDTVQRVMIDSRKGLFDEDNFFAEKKLLAA